jgi:hypothetical protein
MPCRSDLIEALKIAEKYDAGGWACAEHDIVYLIPESIEISDEDRKTLDRLGCHIDEDYGWACFT